MKWAMLFLSACGPLPAVQTTVVVQALDATRVQAIELFVVQGTGLSCDALLTPRGVFIDRAVVRSSSLVSLSASARVDLLEPGTYFAVAHAYATEDALGTWIGQGCAQSEPVVAGQTSKLTVLVQ